MSAPILPTPATTAAIPAARVAQIRKTAQQFEAIFVRQMLSAARKSSFGDNVFNSDGASSQGTDSFLDMQDSHFADIASQKGAFGLAKMIEKQLIHREAQSAGASNPPPLGEVAARRAEPAPAKAGGGGTSRETPSVSLREPPPPEGEDFTATAGTAAKR